jgi:hypothetical protein
MSVKTSKPNTQSRSRKKLIAKITAYIALISAIAGLIATARKYIREYNYVPVQQYYATLKGDCLNSFLRTGEIDAPGGSQVAPEYVTTMGFGDAVRTSIDEISSANKPRTIDEATFLVLKNVSSDEAKEIRLFGTDHIGTLTHFTSGSTVAICVRYASTTGQKETLELSTYEFVPERGSAKRVTIDPYDEKKVRQASAAKSCEILGYPPTKR